jgi:hypothetical protein
MPDIVWTLPGGQQIVGSLTQTIVNASDIVGVQEVTAGATGTRTATSSLSATPLGSLTLSLAIRPSGGIAPPPVDPGLPPSTVSVGTQSFPLSGVNPGSSGGTGGDTAYPGYRGTNQLVEYINPTVTTTITNQWGVEVIIVAATGVVESVNDRVPAADATGTTIASGRYVLSGHGTARDWLLTNATVGATISFTGVVNPDPTPDPTPTPVTGAYPVKAIGLYVMRWPSNGPDISTIPAGVNNIRLAFAQNSPPSMVGWGSQGQSSCVSQLATRRAAGTRVIVSIGGQGGAISTVSRATFMQGIATIKGQLEASSGGGLDGIDWDIEASSLSLADVVWISSQCKALYGANFAITFVPNGGNVTQYLPAAVACHQAGALDEYGQQFYDAPVSLSAAMGRISQAIGAGIPQSKMSVGMMIDSDSNHWTNAQCRGYMASIRQTYPGIVKAYLWEAQRAGTALWVSDMQAVIG